ncbi:YTH domain-containing protein [Artemisia annua]|uniref:YTH domain-containing protein n=1 Tax=Artemisia annua TaxID=35608 RepID=A0A2U1LP00_ARTAN|nr:YTH domain-containing protein [Artemisia annua]
MYLVKAERKVSFQKFVKILRLWKKIMRRLVLKVRRMTTRMRGTEVVTPLRRAQSICLECAVGIFLLRINVFILNNNWWVLLLFSGFVFLKKLTQGSMGMVKVNHLIGPLQPALSVDTTGNGNKGPMRPIAYQNSAFNSTGSYNRGTQSTYQDPRYGFDGVHSPIPWVDSSVYSNGMARNNTNTTPLSNANGFASKNQHFHTNSHLVNPRPMSGMNTASGYMKRMYPNKVYGRKGW